MPTNDPQNTLSGLATGGLGELSPGRLLGGNYQLIEPIGRGGMGQVWKAQDRAGQRIVAIKLLPPELRNHEDAIQQVRESFQKVHALTHQHIGKSLAMLSDADYGPFIVMDLVLGIPLSRYAKQYRQRNGQIPLKHVIELLRPVAQALDYAHVRGVLHRDVKPDNILVQTEPHFEVTLIDFGLAATIRSTMTRFTQASSDTRGTRPYMSPEQLRGNSLQWDGRTDQYSLAVVAYELLGGCLPFEIEDDFALIYAVLNEPVVPIETCSEAVNQVLSKGLGKDRTDRFGNCVSLIDSLASARTTNERAPAVQQPASTQPVRTQQSPTPPPVSKNQFTENFKSQTIINSIGMELKLIPAGDFLMGDGLSELRSEKPVHRVKVSKPFFLGTHPVTSKQFSQFVQDRGAKFAYQWPKGGSMIVNLQFLIYTLVLCVPLLIGLAAIFGGLMAAIAGLEVDRIAGIFFVSLGFFMSIGSIVAWRRRSKLLSMPRELESAKDLPIVNVSWEDAIAFCKWLSAKEKRHYHLPTEAQWEYACRAGSMVVDEKALGFGKSVPPRNNPPSGCEAVSNAWGLFGMGGRLWEWCADWYGEYGSDPVVDPTGPLSGTHRVVRGGGGKDVASELRVACRSYCDPGTQKVSLGFRVVLARSADSL